MARKIGRRVLKCGNRLPNETIMGELGWMSMRGRRMLLRLSYWGKILQMDDGRWVKKVYEQGKARLEVNADAKTWCNLTRRWLLELGLEDEWREQAVGKEWQEKLRSKIEDMEARNWRLSMVCKSKLKDYMKWKQKPELELYLQHRDVHQRRLWTKLRGGCLELRVETGRWERVTVGGKQVRIPRHLRKCKLCFGEVEDARHLLFRCPAFGQQRLTLTVQVGVSAPAKVAAAMRRVQEGGHEMEEMVVMHWMMTGGGHEVGMEGLDGMMRVRRKLLGEEGRK